MTVGYTTGLHELGDGLFAYLQPDGSWGWSNAGLVCGDGASLLVDTLFDLDLTAAMLGAMEPVTAGRPISTLVNTHANGDHCYGNQLVAGAEVVASAATAAEMDEVPPSLLAAMVEADLGDDALNAYVADAFGPFRFTGIDVVPPSRTFTGALALEVAGTAVELVEAGPAHTAGDVIVHVPGAATVFVGDLAFVGGTPLAWAGPLSNWCDAIDLIGSWSPATVVPGHGPVCTMTELVEVRDYLRFVEEEATARFRAGMPAEEAAVDIDLGGYAVWGERERIAINVDTVYRHLDPTAAPTDVLTLFRRMAHYPR